MSAPSGGAGPRFGGDSWRAFGEVDFTDAVYGHDSKPGGCQRCCLEAMNVARGEMAFGGPRLTDPPLSPDPVSDGLSGGRRVPVSIVLPEEVGH